MGVNSPVNITGDISDQCSGLCSLSFNFSDSACTVKKLDPTALNVSYVDSNPANTLYKNGNYIVHHIEIYNRSLHRYNGRRTDAEMLIYFNGTGDSASQTMVISVPIEAQSSSGVEIKSNGAIITSIIKTIKTNSESAELAVKFNSSNSSSTMYNLNDLIPSQQPFYVYVGNKLYESSSSNLVNYVVFPRGSSIYVSADTITHLNKITTPFESPVSGVPQNSVTYNSVGANASESSDVYIECSPAGDDGVILYQTTTDGSAASQNKLNAGDGDISFTNVVENDMFVMGIQIILFGFIGIIIVFLAYKLLTIVSSPPERPEVAAAKGSKKL
jgi:hypothetical protein